MTHSNAEFFARLDANVPKIVTEFQRLTSVPPWTSLTEVEWRDHLPPLLHALFDSTVSSTVSPEAREKSVSLAAAHGEIRRKQEMSAESLLTEYYLLRNAMWNHIDKDVRTPDAVSSIIRLDAAVSIATLASLAGYHRDEYEQVGLWPGVLTNMVKQWEASL
ncbi:MAG TPA: hypothetical protein VFT29_20335 [Gemmatimonadaceae bacterium]|nr:hypothetical protein [Gemmatimonadaceae bacterium]